MPVAGGRFYFFFDVVEPEGAPYERGPHEVLRGHFADWAPGVKTSSTNWTRRPPTGWRS